MESMVDGLQVVDQQGEGHGVNVFQGKRKPPDGFRDVRAKIRDFFSRWVK